MVTKDNQYEVSLDKNAANYVPLTPLSFIERTKDVYPGYTALVYGDRVYFWLGTYNRCLKFASALERHGIGVGDTVSILVIDIRDPDAILQEGEGECLGKYTYDEFIEAGSLDYQTRTPEDEWQAITLNDTSGTTGRPKGVVYHHGQRANDRSPRWRI